MPEGPEVRQYADQLAQTLSDQPIVQLTARTRIAKQWLQQNPTALSDRAITAVTSHGKNLIGSIEGGYYFYSHLMMWGRWITFTETLPTEIDRRERARITVPSGGAILYSAPIFELGQGDPMTQVEVLRSLGPDILSPTFDAIAVQQRLFSGAHQTRPIGAALLDQSIVAGIGNYLRAEMLFECRLDPWRLVETLTPDEVDRLCTVIPQIAQRAYTTGGVTVPDALRARMQHDETLVYRLGSDFGARHYVFRRTNLPCLICNTKIRQSRQPVHGDDSEKTRIIYFCPTCQAVAVPELSKMRSKRCAQSDSEAKTVLKQISLAAANRFGNSTFV